MSSKPDDVSWHEYLKGYGKLRWRSQAAMHRFHEINGTLQPLYGLLYGNLLDQTGPKMVIATRTPEVVQAKGHPPFTFKVQCSVTGRMSRAIPYERMIEFGVLTADTRDGGMFPREKFDVVDRVSPVMLKLQDELITVAPYLDSPGAPWHERYSEYLRSDEWLDIRGRVLKRDKFRCRWSGKSARAGDPLQVHHLTYERVGCEAMEDLITVCRSAHKAHHQSGATA